MSEPRVRVAPWEDIVLRVIAIWKLSHAIFFASLAVLLLRLRHEDLPQFVNDYYVVPFGLNPEGQFVNWILDQAAKVSPHMLFLSSLASFFYAALFFAEGIGLFLRRHWAEYLVVIVSGSLLPLEIYELWISVHWWKIGVVVGNVLIVGYLIHRLMLDAKNKATLQLAHDIASGKSSASSKPQATSKVP